MRYLECRIPPPVIGLIIAAAMWAAANLPPVLQLPRTLRWIVAAVLAIAGAYVALAGVVSFRRAATTVNPLKPETSAALVSTGVYALTRNPMYLGMVLVLLAWAVYLSALWPFIGSPLFAAYITCFQIVPEERVLEQLFGAAFAQYRQRVRRWL